MTGPPPQRPFTDPTDLKPEEWQQYLSNARAALHQNPRDQEALDAIRTANTALGVYDEAEAASPGERIQAGIEGGAKGLGQAALDIPRGIASLFVHPIETVKNIPNIPGQLKNAITSDDPETVARGVGDVGGMLAPFAKAGRAGSFRLGNPSGPTVAGVVGDIGRRLASRVGQVPRAVGDLMDRPGLRNELLRAQISNIARKAQPPTPEAPPALSPDAAPPETPVHPDAAQAMDDFAAKKISGAHLRYAMDVAAGRTPNPADVAAIDAENAPSGVAPTVPIDQTPAPKPPYDPLDQPAFARRATAAPATPTESVSPTPPGAPPNVFTATKAQLPEAWQPRGGFDAVADALQHPAYQNAGILAQEGIRSNLPFFQGMGVADATATLRNLLVSHVEHGGEIPPITTLPKFLVRLGITQ